MIKNRKNNFLMTNMDSPEKVISEFNSLLQKYGHIVHSFRFIRGYSLLDIPSVVYELNICDKNGQYIIASSEGEGKTEQRAKQVAIEKFLSDPIVKRATELRQEERNAKKLADNPIGFLQEFFAKKGVPVYEPVPATISERFAIKCSVAGITAIGEADSKKEAKRKAAHSAFQQYTKTKTVSIFTPEMIESFQNFLRDIKATSPSAQDYDFENHGVEMMKNVISKEAAGNLLESLTRTIEKYAKELSCDLNEYLDTVDQWELTPKMVEETLHLLHMRLEERFMKELVCTKVTLLNMSAFDVPCHQDIAYAQDEMFEFSVIMPLYMSEIVVDSNDKGQFLFECLPSSSSNLKACQPVDFRKPNFYDEKRASDEWDKKGILFSVQSGKIILFDSRLWYRLECEEKIYNRNLLLKTNWRQKSIIFGRDYYCEPNMAFDSWIDKELITKILKQALQHCLQIFLPHDYKECIYFWRKEIKNDNSQQKLVSAFHIDLDEVGKILDKLWLQIGANEKHAGSEYQGTVFGLLWKHLLVPITQRMTVDFDNLGN